MKSSKMIILLLCLLLGSGNLCQAAVQTDRFEGEWPTLVSTAELCPLARLYIDIPEDYWAKKPIEDLTKLRIMEGFRDFTFRPERVITRAELAVLIVRAKEMQLEPIEEEMFWDIRTTSWVAPYIAAVVKEEYMVGYPDGAFRPRQRVSRAEAAITLARAFDLFAEKCEGTVFSDIPREHWACEAIDAAEKMGLLEYLRDDKFEPAAGLTRAEAAEIFSRIPIVKNKIAKLCP
jgi:hypothetical protein